jgi:L-iditol 2-dehydrogenase
MLACRAWVLDGPDNLSLRSFNLERSEGLLRIEAVGLCGTDVHAVRGRLPLSYPLVLGHEAVGRIIGPSDEPESKDRATRFVLAPTRACEHCEACLAGTPTRCSSRKTYGFDFDFSCAPYGAFSDYLALLPGFRLVPVPPSLPTDVAVLTEPLACALSALRRAASVWPLAGARTAVLGAGPIGLLMAIAAELLGAQVTVFERAPVRRELAKQLGLHANDPADGTHCEGKMDHVIDCAGSNAAVEQALRLALRGGVVVVFGSFAVASAIDVSPSIICNRELSVLGASTTHMEDYTIALRLLDWHVSRFRPVVTHRMAMFATSSLTTALSLMESGECGKICLMPTAPN